MLGQRESGAKTKGTSYYQLLVPRREGRSLLLCFLNVIQDSLRRPKHGQTLVAVHLGFLLFGRERMLGHFFDLPLASL